MYNCSWEEAKLELVRRWLVEVELVTSVLIS